MLSIQQRVERQILSAESLQINVRFGSKADMCSAERHVRFTPNSGHAQCKNRCPLCANSGHDGLFDDRVCTPQESVRNCQSKCFGGLEINDKLKFRGLLDWHVGWLLAQDQCHPGQVVAR